MGGGREGGAAGVLCMHPSAFPVTACADFHPDLTPITNPPIVHSPGGRRVKDTFEEKSNYEEFFVVCKVRYTAIHGALLSYRPASADHTSCL